MTCASQIQGAQIDVAVLRGERRQIQTQAAAIQGIKRVLKIENAANAEPLAAVLAAGRCGRRRTSSAPDNSAKT